MLDFFRKGMGSMLAGGLLAILIVSFALWGIGDPLSTLGSTEIAKVGDEDLTPNDLARSFENEFSRLQQNAGEGITRQLAVQIGLGAQAVARLVETKAYDVETKNLGLRTSDEELRDYIFSIPAFQDQTGTFNRSYFDQIARTQGYSTREFENLLRLDLARSKLFNALLEDVVAPEITAKTLTKFASEQRTSEILSIPASTMTGIGEMNDEILKAYYDENTNKYMAPEYRDISYFEISASDLADTIDISDEDALASYESRLTDFTKPEKRGFVQMLMDDEATAEAAYNDLQSGKSFDEVLADKTGDTAEDSTFGEQTEKEFGDLYGEDAAKALFSLGLDEYTSPIETGFGVYIFKVNSIDAGSSDSFETVKDDIITDLKMNRATDALYDVRNRIDDELAAGSAIDTIANVINVPLKKVSNVSLEGMTPDGKASTDLPLIVDFLDNSFKLSMDSDLELYEGISNKFYMIKIDNIMPSKLRAFEEVQEKVGEDWAQDRRETLASEYATKIVDEFSKPENAGMALSEYPGLLSQLSVNEVTVGRSNDDNSVSAEIHSSIFDQKIGTVKMIPASNNDGYVVVRVKSRDFPENIDQAAIDETKNQIKTSYENDLMGAYISRLYDTLPVEMNNRNIQATLQQIAGPEQQ
ncbi:MAG: SurA N-terminal domain-containing protein [Emcibacteraceae bacterium]